MAIRWYDLPHEGAHATQVIAYGVGVASVSATGFVAMPSEEEEGGGEGSRVRRVVGRLDGDDWIICHNRG